MSIDKATESEAFQFCQLGLENGLLDQSQVDIALNYFKGQTSSFIPIEEVLVRFRFVEERSVKHLKTALTRLQKDNSKNEVIIPGYRILSKIGDGGLGTVYKAKQLTMNRNVALKVLHPKWLSDEEFSQRFLLEARMVGKMSHPNLLQVYDVSQAGSYLYFSMEFIDGQSVEDIVDNEGALPQQIVINIILQIIESLDYIRRFDVVHRDVKPGNILLTKDGVAKLGDFGFLKSKYDESIQTDGQVLGTPDYIAPEQAMGHDIDFKADIYSLGVTMYHMLIGELPYDGSVSTIIRNHIDKKADSIDKKIPTIPKSLARVVSKMMEKKPDHRYSSYDDLKKELFLVNMSDEVKNEKIEEGRATVIKAFATNPSSNSEFIDISLFKVEKQLFWTRIFMVISLIANVILLYYFYTELD